MKSSIPLSKLSLCLADIRKGKAVLGLFLVITFLDSYWLHLTACRQWLRAALCSFMFSQTSDLYVQVYVEAIGQQLGSFLKHCSYPLPPPPPLSVPHFEILGLSDLDLIS